MNTPQPWISNIAVTPKANGEIRLDAREINKAIRREKFPIPTLDSLIDSMSGMHTHKSNYRKEPEI